MSTFKFKPDDQRHIFVVQGLVEVKQTTEAEPMHFFNISIRIQIDYTVFKPKIMISECL